MVIVANILNNLSTHSDFSGVAIGDKMAYRRKGACSYSGKNCFAPGFSEVGWVDDKINSSGYCRKKYNCFPKIFDFKDFFGDDISSYDAKAYF